MLTSQKTGNLAPLAAALLALSPLTSPSNVSAAEGATSGAPLPYSQKSDLSYSGSELIALTKFVDIVASCDDIWPSNGYRLAVMSQLEKNGTLQELALLPLEQETLLQVARYGPIAVQTSIAAARVNARGAKTVTQEALFKLLRSAQTIDTAESGVSISSPPPQSEITKGLCVAFWLAARLELQNPNAWAKERIYMESLEEPKRTSVTLLTGALLMQRTIPVTNPDRATILSFIKAWNSQVADTDRTAIPFFKQIPELLERNKAEKLSEERKRAALLVSPVLALGYYLWRRATRKLAEPSVQAERTG